MSNYNAVNERVKRDYFDWKRHADGKAESTINEARQHIARYEAYTDYKEFGTFNSKQAIGFKGKLVKEKISLSTMRTILNNLMDFFKWLAGQKGYVSKIFYNDIAFLQLPQRDARIAKSKSLKEYPTIEQVKHALSLMPEDTVIQKRNRAFVAFTLLSGMRDSAIVSLKIRHVAVDKELISQKPSDGVNTKFGKTIFTWFFPVGDDIKTIVIDWIKVLREVLLYGDQDPLFPRLKQSMDENYSFKYKELEPVFLQSASPMRKVFKEAFQNAGLQYYSPHKFRDTLANYGEKICKSPEDFKAWSQNLGHEHVLTTFTSYGYVDENRQGEIIRNLSKMETEEDKMDEILSLLKGKVGA